MILGSSEVRDLALNSTESHGEKDIPFSITHQSWTNRFSLSLMMTNVFFFFFLNRKSSSWVQSHSFRILFFTAFIVTFCLLQVTWCFNQCWVYGKRLKSPNHSGLRKRSLFLSYKCSPEVNLPRSVGRFHDHQETSLLLSCCYTPSWSNVAAHAPAIMFAFQLEGWKKGMLKCTSSSF